MVSPTGVEPVTYALGGHCAIQLCHGDNNEIISKRADSLFKALSCFSIIHLKQSDQISHQSLSFVCLVIYKN